MPRFSAAITGTHAYLGGLAPMLPMLECIDRKPLQLLPRFISARTAKGAGGKCPHLVLSQLCLHCHRPRMPTPMAQLRTAKPYVRDIRDQYRAVYE